MSPPTSFAPTLAVGVKVHFFFGHGAYLIAGASAILGFIIFRIFKRRKTT